MDNKKQTICENRRGVVDKLVYSGDGLIRGKNNLEEESQSSLVTFIPFVAPSELVDYTIHTEKKNYRRASLLSIIEASPHRVLPVCTHFGQCGGCQLQHIAYDHHGKIKKDWIEEAFFKLKDFMDEDVSWLSLPPIWQWRKKISLHVVRNNSEWIIGYWNENNSRILSISECPIFFYPDEVDILIDLKHILNTLFPPKGIDSKILVSQITVSLLRLDQFGSKRSFALHMSFSGVSRNGHLISYLQAKAERLLIDELKKCSWAQQASYSVDMHPQKKMWKNLFGTPFMYIEIGGISCKAPFHAFMQNHPTMSHAVWQDVIKIMRDCFIDPSSHRILDLYAGIGVTALLLAHVGFAVDAVEISRAACKACQESCDRYPFAKQVRVLPYSVEAALMGENILRRPHEYAAWIINPPREGASKDVIQSLASGAYGSFGVYTSCNPSTLQRDIRSFTDSGWRIRSVKGYDMFPMTTHFETVVTLYRSEQ